MSMYTAASDLDYYQGDQHAQAPRKYTGIVVKVQCPCKTELVTILQPGTSVTLTCGHCKRDHVLTAP
jgi:hypothetical protein